MPADGERKIGKAAFIMAFKLLKKEGNARRGVMETVHGTIQTPVFMNVGT